VSCIYSVWGKLNRKRFVFFMEWVFVLIQEEIMLDDIVSPHSMELCLWNFVLKILKYFKITQNLKFFKKLMKMVKLYLKIHFIYLLTNTYLLYLTT
jgi:hypothetical protein